MPCSAAGIVCGALRAWADGPTDEDDDDESGDMQLQVWRGLRCGGAGMWEILCVWSGLEEARWVEDAGKG
eukprot:364541-Chlamydomonas_euryale.AAC.12